MILSVGDNIYKMINFSDIPVSTQTFTVKSNIQYINLRLLFDKMNLSSFIVLIKFHDMIKGEVVKPLTKKKKLVSSTPVLIKRNFLNCVTLVIEVEKKINVKVFKNGVFQLTGCKNVENVKDCINIIIKEMKKINETYDTEKCFHFAEEPSILTTYTKSAMRNIDFNMGFNINRASLAERIKTIYSDNEDVIVPDNVGNKMDVKIKVRISKEEVKKVPILKTDFHLDDLYNFTETHMNYEDCIHKMEVEDKKIENKLRNKFVSISIFQNGKILLSSMDETIQERYYKWLVGVLEEIKPYVQQDVMPKKTFLLGKKLLKK